MDPTPIPSADHHVVDGVAYSVTAATDCTVTSDTGLNLAVKAGTQGFLVGDGGTVHVEGNHYFTQCGGNFSPASTGGGGGGDFDGHLNADFFLGNATHATFAASDFTPAAPIPASIDFSIKSGIGQDSSDFAYTGDIVDADALAAAINDAANWSLVPGASVPVTATAIDGGKVRLTANVAGTIGNLHRYIPGNSSPFTEGETRFTGGSAQNSTDYRFYWNGKEFVPGRVDGNLYVGHGAGPSSAEWELHLGDLQSEGSIVDSTGEYWCYVTPAPRDSVQVLVTAINTPWDPVTGDGCTLNEIVTAEAVSDTVIKLVAKVPGDAANGYRFIASHNGEPDTTYPCFGNGPVEQTVRGLDDVPATARKIYLNGEEFTGGVAPDTELSPTSTNAVENRVIHAALNYHATDMSLHNSSEQATQIRYLIDNYGKAPVSPVPAPHPDPSEHGEGKRPDGSDWEYLSDSQLVGYFSDDLVKKEGKWPVYGVVLPWYNQPTGSADTHAELYTGDISGTTPGEPVGIEGYLPDCCNGCPWLFDSLVTENGVSRPRRWSPAYREGDQVMGGVDEWADEPLFKWYDVNYVRCNNGNRRITAVRGMTTFAETGEVDVGVAYHRRYVYHGRVRATVSVTDPTTHVTTSSDRDFTLLLISGGPSTDTAFPDSVRQFLAANFKVVDDTGAARTDLTIQPQLWKSCQRYEWNETSADYDIVPAPYGLHAKWHSVLAGSGATGCLPRSQRGHLLTNVSHNTSVYNTGTVTDGLTSSDGTTKKKGYTDYRRKGAGYTGGGMDRTLFLGLHLMMKTGTKNTQKFMRGQVSAGELNIPCAMSTEDAQAAGILPSGSVSSAVVASGSIGNLGANDWVAVGSGSGHDFGTAKVACGRVLNVSEEQTTATGVKYRIVDIELWHGYGQTGFTHTASYYVSRVFAPCGYTDEVIGRKDGSAHDLTGTHCGPCQFMGTEYGMGAWSINTDTTLKYVTGNLLQLYYAPPWMGRSTDAGVIASTYIAVDQPFGKSGSYYGADLVVDPVRGTYYQTAPASGTGSSSTGMCDQVYKDSSTSEMRAYCSYGGVIFLTGLTAGLFGVYVSNGLYTGLGNGYWFSCSCD